MEHSITIKDALYYLQEHWIVFSIATSFLVLYLFKNKIKKNVFEALLAYPINAALMAFTIMIDKWYFQQQQSLSESHFAAVVITVCFLFSPISIIISMMVCGLILGIVVIDTISNLIRPLL